MLCYLAMIFACACCPTNEKDPVLYPILDENRVVRFVSFMDYLRYMTDNGIFQEGQRELWERFLEYQLRYQRATEYCDVCGWKG
jgi:hypothetical protein